jgi:RHS repeat-associated protein
VRSQTETPKRYRYTGKERDGENGLDYVGARYYASWLGRWTCPDPKPPSGDVNLYAFVQSNPIKFVDRTGNEESRVDEPSTHEARGTKKGDEPEESNPLESVHHGVELLDLLHVTLELTIRNAHGELLRNDEIVEFATHHAGSALLKQGRAVGGATAFGLVLAGLNIPLGAIQIGEGFNTARKTHWNQGGSDVVQGTLVFGSGVATFGGVAGSTLAAGAAPLLAAGSLGFAGGRLLDEHLHLSDKIVDSLTRDRISYQRKRDDAEIQEFAREKHEDTLRAQRYKAARISWTQEREQAYESWNRSLEARVESARRDGLVVDVDALTTATLHEVDEQLAKIDARWKPVLQANRP